MHYIFVHLSMHICNNKETINLRVEEGCEKHQKEGTWEGLKGGKEGGK